VPGLWPPPDDPIVEEIREVARRLGLARRARELDRAPDFPRKEFRALGDAGLLGLTVPRTRGGRALPLPRAAAALYHLAYLGGTAFAKLSLQPEFCSVLAEHGSSELVDQWFLPLVRGERLVGNQVTEPDAGSDAGAIALAAVRDRDGYQLQGRKSEVAFALDAEAAIVYGRTSEEVGSRGITAFLVPQSARGVRRIPGAGDLGERWQRRGSVEYDRVRVPSGLRLGDEGRGFSYLRRELEQERGLLAAIYLGVARASWDETVAYVGRRRAFGRPLADQQGVAFPLVDDGARLEAAWLLTVRALTRLEAGEGGSGETAAAKALATEVALRTIDHAIQFHGGRGYSGGLPHEQRWRDVRSGPIAHGPSEIMRLIVAREIWTATSGTGAKGPGRSRARSDRVGHARDGRPRATRRRRATQM
jgi:cyclohexanecarboxyl-CoA dehydrogenase